MNGEASAGGQIGETLSKVEIWAGMTPADRERYARRTSLTNFEAGDELLTRDSESRDVFFVIDGEIRIVNHSLSGREIAYAILRKGSYFGELAALDGQRRSASVFAITDGTLATMGADDFCELLRANPDASMTVIRRLTKIIRSCDEKIMDLSVLSAHQRVYRELLGLMRPDPVRADRFLIYPLPTQSQIAAHAGTTRETVARVLSNLTGSSLVERKGRTLYIRDPETLKTLSERADPGFGSDLPR